MPSTKPTQSFMSKITSYSYVQCTFKHFITLGGTLGFGRQKILNNLQKLFDKVIGQLHTILSMGMKFSLKSWTLELIMVLYTVYTDLIKIISPTLFQK